METLTDAAKFLVETGQPLMYFENKKSQRYRFKGIEITEKDILYPYEHEKTGHTITIKVPKSSKGDINSYRLQRDKVYSKVKIDIQ